MCLCRVFVCLNPVCVCLKRLLLSSFFTKHTFEKPPKFNIPHPKEALLACRRLCPACKKILDRTPPRPVRPLRLLNFSKLHDFLMPEKEQKSTPCLAVRAPLGHNGVLPALQRRPRCNTTRPSLQPRKGLTADQSAPDVTSTPRQYDHRFS